MRRGRRRVAAAEACSLVRLRQARRGCRAGSRCGPSIATASGAARPRNAPRAGRCRCRSPAPGDGPRSVHAARRGSALDCAEWQVRRAGRSWNTERCVYPRAGFDVRVCARMTIHALPHRQLARLLVASILACTLAACATLRTNYVKSESRALAPPASTPTTRYIESEVAAHPGQSGFRLLISNTDALMSRVVLADHAQRSIDLQYYIFRNDPTGRLIAQRLLTAADRGVRVRILLDDLDIVEEDPLLDALDAHANIEVRLFNPFSIRNRSLLSKGGQFLLEGRRLN